MKAFESGLRDKNLVTSLRPFLRKSGITDDELMRSVNELATKNAERKAKIGAATERNRIAKAHAIIAENEKGNSQIPNSSRNGNSRLDNEVSKLSAEIKSRLKIKLTLRLEVIFPLGFLVGQAVDGKGDMMGRLVNVVSHVAIIVNQMARRHIVIIAFNAGSKDTFAHTVLTTEIRETCRGYFRGARINR